MLNIIRKRIKSSEAAATDFQAAKREDLRAREVAQIAVLNTFILDSNSIGADEITATAQGAITEIKTQEKEVNLGSVMKALLGPGGRLEEKQMDRSDVARIVGTLV